MLTNIGKQVAAGLGFLGVWVALEYVFRVWL